MIRFPVFLAALAFAAPASAFDGLWRDLALAAANPASDQPAFYYAAPDPGIDPREAVWVIGAREMAEAMIDPALPTELTGVDFSAMTAVFETGTPPNQVTIVHGAAGFTAAAPSVLGERGFTLSDQDGFTIASKGEDHKINAGDRILGEPFAGSLGKSYRLAIASDYAILAFSTPLMAEVTAAMADAEACETCLPWRSLLAAVREAAGPEAHLEAASGYPIASLVAMPIRMGNDEPVEMTPSLVPPYLFAMFAVTRDASHHPTLFMSLFFPDEESARAGAKAVGNGMAAMLAEADEEGSPFEGAAVTPVADGLIATLTMTFDHPRGAVLGYNRFIQMVMNRSFELLTPG